MSSPVAVRDDADRRAMTEISLRSDMPVSAASLFAWHERDGAFERLTPAFMPVRVIARDEGIRDGSRVTVDVPVGPVHTRWVVEHRGYVAGQEFSDAQVSGPFARWEHRHQMLPQGEDSSVLEDRVRFALPAPPFGGMVADAFTRARLTRLLQWRHALTRLDLERHAAFAARGPRRIAITGANGFLGAALVPFLTTGGHDVRRVALREALAGDGAGNLAAALAGADAVVHLAGEPIAQRWSARVRRELKESRVRGTRLIAEACARMSPRPEVLLSGSAVGIYGDRGDEILDESSASGDDYLAEVARAWEESTAPARDAGIRVVHLRTGIVLNPGGGALGKMLLPFQSGVGGRLGNGAQWMSWISREDWIGAAHFALQSPGVHGAVNLTAPEPVTNATFTSTLGRVLHRPTVAAVPAFALRALFGEMATATIFASQRATPRVLEGAGFQFAHPTLASALRFELGLL